MIYELNVEEMEQVEGGNFLLALGDEAKRRMVVGVIDIFTQWTVNGINWARSAAPGGADQGTWESIGRSQMGA